MPQDDLFIRLLGTPVAAGLTRRLISQRINKWSQEDILDNVLLVASELVANASEAAPNQELRLHLSHTVRGVLLELWDPSSAIPVTTPLRDLTLAVIDQAPDGAWDHGGGWGLPIVQTLSAECGYRPTQPAGKWVWALFTGA